MITELKRIVLAEDNPNDVELTLAALADINLANEVVVVRDGAFHGEAGWGQFLKRPASDYARLN